MFLPPFLETPTVHNKQRRHLPEDMITLIKKIPFYGKKFPNHETII